MKIKIFNFIIHIETVSRINFTLFLKRKFANKVVSDARLAENLGMETFRLYELLFGAKPTRREKNRVKHYYHAKRIPNEYREHRNLYRTPESEIFNRLSKFLGR